jgi:hypothetical protein
LPPLPTIFSRLAIPRQIFNVGFNAFFNWDGIRRGQVIDLMQALKQSMEQAKTQKKPAAAAQKKRKTAS